VLCPLLRQRENVVHPSAEPWVERAWYTPFLSLRIARDALWWVVHAPIRTLSTVAVALAHVASTPNFVLGTLGIVPKSLSLARRLQDADVTHVHAHFATHPTMAAWMIWRLTGIPYSFTGHAHDIYVHQAMLGRKIRDARFVVTVSHFNRRLLETMESSTPVHVIHCGVETGLFSPRAGPRNDTHRLTIVSVASLQPYKGIENLVQACGLLRAQGHAFSCVIVGDGELRRPLQRMTSDLDLDGSVEFLGPQTEERVREIVGTADVFVLPSVVMKTGKMEGLPVALVEALALGVPVVASAISGIPELVRAGETGQLVPPGDPGEIARAIARVAEDRQAATAMAARGRSLVEQEFDLQKNVRRLTALFRKAASP
jgi:colanic acid/amylovoran biosynthesis glycosyltransferase